MDQEQRGLGRNLGDGSPESRSIHDCRSLLEYAAFIGGEDHFEDAFRWLRQKVRMGCMFLRWTCFLCEAPEDRGGKQIPRQRCQL